MSYVCMYVRSASTSRVLVPVLLAQQVPSPEVPRFRVPSSEEIAEISVNVERVQVPAHNLPYRPGMSEMSESSVSSRPIKAVGLLSGTVHCPRQPCWWTGESATCTWG